MRNIAQQLAPHHEFAAGVYQLNGLTLLAGFIALKSDQCPALIHGQNFAIAHGLHGGHRLDQNQPWRICILLLQGKVLAYGLVALVLRFLGCFLRIKRQGGHMHHLPAAALGDIAHQIRALFVALAVGRKAKARRGQGAGGRCLGISGGGLCLRDYQLRKPVDVESLPAGLHQQGIRPLRALKLDAVHTFAQLLGKELLQALGEVGELMRQGVEG